MRVSLPVLPAIALPAFALRALALPALALPALALASLVAATPLAADGTTPMTGAEFDAYSRGKTLYFNVDGHAYGAEQYLPDQKVIWAFTEDECRRGDWYQQDRFICFVYEDNPDPQCWTFFDTAEGLIARFEDNPDDSTLVSVEQSREPLYCPGPDVGV